jgi:hypothetical protein
VRDFHGSPAALVDLLEQLWWTPKRRPMRNCECDAPSWVAKTGYSISAAPCGNTALNVGGDGGLAQGSVALVR